MTTGGRTAHSLACHPAQLLSPSRLAPCCRLSCTMGGRWKPLSKAGWGIGRMFPPTPFPATTGKRLFLINTLWLMLPFSLWFGFFIRIAFFPTSKPQGI